MKALCLCWAEVEGIFLCKKTEELGGTVMVSSDLENFQWVPPTGSQLTLLGQDELAKYYKLETKKEIFVLEQTVNALRIREFPN